MKTWYHRKVKNSWQWIGFDFLFRLLPFSLLIVLSYLFIPDIRGEFFLVNMNFYSWILTIVLCLIILVWSFLSQKRTENGYIHKLHHHHYKHLMKKNRKQTSVILYKILLSAPITSFFCFVLFPALLRHYLPFHDVFLIFPAALLFPLQNIFLEGHSGRNFFWQTFVSIWLIMFTYVIQSALFPLLISICLAFGQLYISKPISKGSTLATEKAN